MNDNKLAIIVLLATVGLIGGGMLLAYKSSQAPQVSAVAGVSVMVNQDTHEWGEIPINGGNVSASFPIKNDGSETLKLFNVSTSCMCTTAQLILGDVKSPEFGMHTRSASVFEVPPGETATLEVVFDPDFHGPNGVGEVVRQVVAQTNDASRSELDFSLTGTVIN